MAEYAAEARCRLRCSPEVAFAAWIEPAILPTWLAPPPYDMTRAEVDARVGGRYRHDVAGPEAEPHVVVGEFFEFVPGVRLCFDWRYSGPNPAPRPEPTMVSVTFEQVGTHETQVTLRHSELRDERELAHFNEGWRDCFSRLERLYA